MSFVNVEQEPISFTCLVECRRQEMESILPGLQTRFTWKGKDAVVESHIKPGFRVMKDQVIYHGN